MYRLCYFLFSLCALVKLISSQPTLELSGSPPDALSIDCRGAETTITSTSEQTLVNWNHFSIPENEKVSFALPSAKALIINNVLESASLINGELISNGRVVLINPSGVLIGKNGVIDTAEFIASTFKIDENSLFKGKPHFLDTDTEGKITILGTIKEGSAIFFAKDIDCQGELASKNGGHILVASNTLKQLGVCNPRRDGVLILGSGKTVLFQPSKQESIYLTCHLKTLSKESCLSKDGALLVNDFYSSVIHLDKEDFSSTLEVKLQDNLTIRGNVKLNHLEIGNTNSISFEEGTTLQVCSAELIASEIGLFKTKIEGPNGTQAERIVLNVDHQDKSLSIKASKITSKELLLASEGQLLIKNALQAEGLAKTQSERCCFKADKLEITSCGLLSIHNSDLEANQFTFKSLDSLSIHNSLLTAADLKFTHARPLSIYDSFLNAASIEINSLTSDGTNFFQGVTLDNSSLTSPNIKINSDFITLTGEGGSHLKACGDFGGGVINLRALKHISVCDKSTLLNHAIQKGDGGTVKLLADQTINLDGKINISGGKEGGDGGELELSTMHFNWRDSSLVRGGGKEGNPGKVILDPTLDVIIAANPEAFPADTDKLPPIWIDTEKLLDELEKGPVGIFTPNTWGEEGRYAKITLKQDNPLFYNSPYALSLHAEEGRIYLLSSICNSGSGDIQAYSRHLNIDQVMIETGGNIKIGTQEKPLMTTTLDQATLKTGGSGSLSIHSNSFSMCAGKQAKATLETQAGDIFLNADTAIIESSDENSALITIEEGGSLFAKGDLSLISNGEMASIQFGSSPSFVRIGQELSLTGQLGEALILAEGPLYVEANYINLITFNQKAAIHSTGALDLFCKNTLHLFAAEEGESAITSDEILRVRANGLIYALSTEKGATKLLGDQGLAIQADKFWSKGRGFFTSPNGQVRLLAQEAKLESLSTSPTFIGKSVAIYACQGVSLREKVVIEAIEGDLKIAAGRIDFLDSSQAIARKGDLLFESTKSDITLNESSYWLTEQGGIKVKAARHFSCVDNAHLTSFGQKGIILEAGANHPLGGFQLSPHASINANDYPVLIETNKRGTVIEGVINKERLITFIEDFNTKQQKFCTTINANFDSSLNDNVFDSSNDNLFDHANDHPNDHSSKSPSDDFFNHPSDSFSNRSSSGSKESFFKKPVNDLLKEVYPFKIFYREPGEVHLANQVVSSAVFDQISTTYLGPFTAELFRDLHPYNAFTEDSIAFIDQHVDKSLHFYGIKRRTFPYQTPPPLFPSKWAQLSHLLGDKSNSY